jgi:hypothetical protein
MSLLSRLFPGRPNRTPAAVASQFAHSALPSSSQASRRELLKAVLRDSLRRHGIPAEWIVGEALTSASRQREPGLHWRLSIRHWDERLPVLCVAIQNSLMQRLQGFDPAATSWLQGISWEFSLSDESACPALPPASAWKPAEAAASIAPAAVPVAAASAAAVAGADTDVRADLEKLMSALDAQYAKAAPGDARGFAATEPAGL